MAHNILGIDFGSRRIGLAVSVDGLPPRRLMALPNDENIIESVRHQIVAQAAGVVVIGLPRNLDGDETAQTAAVRAFADRLRTSASGAAIYMQDEALTSEVARERLNDQIGPREEGRVDQEAAVIILEDYIRGTQTS